MEAAGAEPYAMAVPHQELHAGAVFPGKEEGLAVAGRMTRSHSGKAGQCGDTGAHIGGLADEPETLKVQHSRSSRMRAAIPAGVEVTLAARRLSVATSDVPESVSVTGRSVFFAGV